MKKPYILPIILFIGFLVIDMVLYAVWGNWLGNTKIEVFFLPAIFLEIALWGCIIMYLIIKQGGKKDD